jgi:hypothetical protein
MNLIFYNEQNADHYFIFDEICADYFKIFLKKELNNVKLCDEIPHEILYKFNEYLEYISYTNPQTILDAHIVKFIYFLNETKFYCDTLIYSFSNGKIN